MSRWVFPGLLLLAAAGAALAPAPAEAREVQVCVRNSLQLNVPVNVQIARTRLDPATNEVRPEPTPAKPLDSGNERCESFMGSSRAPVIVEVNAIGGGNRLICHTELGPFRFLVTVSGSSIVGASCTSTAITAKGANS